MLIPKLYVRELIDCTNNSCRVNVSFNSNHPLYLCHFPEMPVTPGVCLIQTATELLQEVVGYPIHIKEAIKIKFFQTHSPENLLNFDLSWFKERELRGRISIFQGKKSIAKIDAYFEPS